MNKAIEKVGKKLGLKRPPQHPRADKSLEDKVLEIEMVLFPQCSQCDTTMVPPRS